MMTLRDTAAALSKSLLFATAEGPFTFAKDGIADPASDSNLFITVASQLQLLHLYLAER